LAEHLYKNYNRVILIRQKEDRDYGWWTDRQGKLRYAYCARDAVVTGNACLMEDYICTNPWVPEATRRTLNLKKFYDQMGRYTLVTTKPTNPFAQNKVTVSGKVNEKGKMSETCNDDQFLLFTWGCDMVNRIMYREIPHINYSLIFSD
jgi:hypothetical protein